jgi:hypothetical protein
MENAARQKLAFSRFAPTKASADAVPVRNFRSSNEERYLS